MITPRDNNRIPVLLGVSNADGITPIAPYADPTTHKLMVETGVTGTDMGSDDASRDENRVTGLLAVSNVDGITPVPLYVNSVTKKLLIQIL